MASEIKIPAGVRTVGKVCTWKGKFRVYWTDVDGKDHSKTFATDAVAEKWRKLALEAAAQRAQLATNALDFRAPDGTTGWWSDLLARLAWELVTSDDAGAKNQLRKDLSTIGAASKAIKPLVDQADIERRISEMEDLLAEVRAKRKTGAGTRGTFGPAPDGVGPEPAIY